MTFAGFTDEGRRFQDTQSFSLDGLRWTDVTPAGGKPGERCLHTGALRREARQMVIYGGQRAGLLDDLWTFDLDARSWTEWRPGARPSGRFFASSFADRDGRFYVFGGATASGNVNETWSFDFAAGAWTKLELPGAPSPRNGAMGALVEGEERFVVFGGAGGAFYTTALSLVNPGASEARVTAKFLGHDGDGRGGAEKELTVPAGGTAAWRDVLGELFGLEQGYGAVRISSATSSLILAAETSTPSAAGGSFGQSVPGLGDAELVRAGASRTIPAVRENTAFRANLVLANATEVPIDVDVTFVSDAGAAIATKRISLPPLGMIQVSRVVLDLGAPSGSAGRLVVSTPTPGGAFAAYASVIDNATNDPRTLLVR